MMNKLFTTTFLPVWLKGRKAQLVLSAGVYVVIYTSWLLFKWTDPAYELLISGLGYLPLSIFSAIGAMYAATQTRLDRRTRRAWQLIALGIIFSAVADIIYTILENTRGIGFPDLPDFFYLAYYPLVFIGLATIPTQLADPAQAKTWKLDLAATIISASAILWYFIIAPTAIAGGEDWASRLVAGTYPAMDTLIVASIVSLLFRRSEINTWQSLYILGSGLLLYVIADVVYAWLVLQDIYLSGSWVDILYTTSNFLVGVAALRQANPYLVESETSQVSRSAWLASTLPFFAVIAALLVSFYAGITGDSAGLRTTGLIIGTAIAALITTARQIITLRENSRLVDELNLASDQLRTNAKILEERVVTRTRELESQTNRLRLASQIARDTALAKTLENLLERSATIILERFSLYYTGIFLLDQKREYAVLTASPTEAGQQMIAGNYRVRMGDAHIVARVVATGAPATAFAADPDSVRINNPLLPNTRSEMALPLKVEDNFIGVLDLQSENPGVFNEDDLAVMQIIADQLAIAIERMRLLQQVEQNLSDLQEAYGEFTREGWKTLRESSVLNKTGYRFDNIRIQPISEIPEHGNEAMKTGTRVIRSNKNKKAAENQAIIPIKLRGQTIGVVSANLKDGYTQNTISTLELAIERLAQSLESARLYEQARLRADREQAIAQVATNISSATEFDAILRTTVEEIGRSLGDAEVSIQIISDSEKKD
jgi:GAF domain-containing protein